MPGQLRDGILKSSQHLLEWRNWQTHGTQNPALFTEHVGSTPTSSTTIESTDYMTSHLALQYYWAGSGGTFGSSID